MPHYTLYDPLWYCSLLRTRAPPSNPPHLTLDSHASFQKYLLYTDQFGMFPRSQREFLRGRARWQMALISGFCGEVLYHWDIHAWHWNEETKGLRKPRSRRTSKRQIDTMMHKKSCWRGALEKCMQCCLPTTRPSGKGVVLSELSNSQRDTIHQFTRKLVRLKDMDPMLMLVALFFVAVFVRVFDESVAMQQTDTWGATAADTRKKQSTQNRRQQSTNVMTESNQSNSSTPKHGATKRFPSLSAILHTTNNKSGSNKRPQTPQEQRNSPVNLVNTVTRTESGVIHITTRRLPSWCTLQVLYLASFMIAVKMFDPDLPKSNISFFQIFRLSKVISLEQLNEAELFMLKVLDFNANVSLEEFVSFVEGYAPVAQEYISVHAPEPQTALSSSSVSELEHDDLDFF